MTQTLTTDPDRTATTSCDPATSTTKSMLGYGVIAGPVYVLAVGIQAFTRDGFDIGRHAASLLSNGDLGWIQMAFWAAIVLAWAWLSMVSLDLYRATH